MQVFILVFLLLHDWVPLGPLNDIAGVRTQITLSQLALGTLINSIAIAITLEIAKRSGGRLYLPENTSHLSLLYDDSLENLKMRYVIKYKSSSCDDPSLPRKVRVALVDSKTGKPLEIARQGCRRTDLYANRVSPATNQP